MRFQDEDPDRRMRLRLDFLIALMVVQIVLSVGLWVDRYRAHDESESESAALSQETKSDPDDYSLGQTPSQTNGGSDVRLPETTQAEPEPMAPPQVKVQILNGCGKTGIAKKAREYLAKHDYEVRDVGNADRQDYRFSEVLNRGNNATAARDLARQLGIDESRVKRKPASPGLDVELTLIIGADFRRLSFGK